MKIYKEKKEIRLWIRTFDKGVHGFWIEVRKELKGSPSLAMLIKLNIGKEEWI